MKIAAKRFHQMLQEMKKGSLLLHGQHQPFPKFLLASDLKMCRKLLHLLRFFFPGAFEDLYLKKTNSICR